MTSLERLASTRNTFSLGIGLLSAVGTAFLLQELIRTWLDIRRLRGSMVAASSEPGGMLHLSGAALPCAALYVVGHIWIVVMAVQWINGRAPNASQTAVLGVLAVLAGWVHFFVWGPFRSWILWPTLF
jgi:hypothetical protein